MNNRITFENVTLSYDRRPAIHHLSGVFQPASKTAIVGPNGAGKSTLLKALMRQRLGVEGKIDFGGLRPQDFGYLPQLAEIERSFPVTVADVVAMGAWRKTGAFRSLGADLSAKAAAAIDAVGLTGFEARQIASLSGGQMQRTLFARLILQDAPVILLDEPFTAIDEATTADLLAIIEGWHREGRMVMAVLHDIDQVRAAFPETLLVARRMIGWGPTAEVLTEANLRLARSTTTAWMANAGPCEPAKGRAA
ncbi:metal ABC transporter ATP-binding protein [Thioclava sp. GXIMD4216]|uniref:metal ABC transporter ATP-binding protein n=1 Tax=unclassified Thioclava TaxID=2621713 RepID=UPI0030D56267